MQYPITSITHTHIPLGFAQFLGCQTVQLIETEMKYTDIHAEQPVPLSGVIFSHNFSSFSAIFTFSVKFFQANLFLHTSDKFFLLYLKYT